jgi:hypothetical protein
MKLLKLVPFFLLFACASCSAQYTTNPPGTVGSLPINTTNPPSRYSWLTYATNQNAFVVCGADQNDGDYFQTNVYLTGGGWVTNGIYDTNAQSSVIYSNIFTYSDFAAKGRIGRTGTYWAIYNFVSGIYTEMYLNTNVSGSYGTNPPPTGWTTNANDAFGNLVPPTKVSPQILTTTNYL